MSKQDLPNLRCGMRVRIMGLQVLPNDPSDLLLNELINARNNGATGTLLGWREHGNTHLYQVKHDDMSIGIYYLDEWEEIPQE